MAKRAILLVLDSFGIGASADSAKFGDSGADTLGHIAEYCAHQANAQSQARHTPLQLPNLYQLGLGHGAIASRNKPLAGFNPQTKPSGAYGFGVEQSCGKDTPSGHWEMAGLPVDFAWGYFPPDYPSFPLELTQALIATAKLPGLLGNHHASGTQIILELGDEHLRTGKPIIYTSADSVLQIAAHEQSFGLERLYQVCKIARKIADTYRIGRVIARPFLGKSGHYYRTANRQDFTTPPHGPTLLDYIQDAQGTVIAIGKIGDIFAHRAISHEIKAAGNMALFAATLAACEQYQQDKTLIFSNFVDFDSNYGHRRDVAGYAKALEDWDARLPELQRILLKDDLVIITADHGCDPTMPGSDHTREHIPILAFGQRIKPTAIGQRNSFADIGQTCAAHLGIKPLAYGQSFLDAITD